VKRIVIVYFVLFLASPIYGQLRTSPDSLENLLQTKELTIDQQIDIYNSLCLYYCTNNLEKTIYYGEKGLELAIKAGNQVLEATFYRHIGGGYDVKAEFDSALHYYNKSYELALETNDLAMEGRAYRMLTFTYFRQGKYALALENCMKVLKIYEHLNDEEGVMTALSNIGEINQIMGNTDRAFHYLIRAEKLAVELNHVYGKMHIYNTLGSVYMDKDDLDKAMECYNMALDASYLGGNILTECRSYQNMAKVEIERGNYDKALNYANRSQLLADDVGDPTILVTTWQVLSTIYMEQKRYKQSETAALKAWEIDSTNIDTAPNLAYNITLSNLYLGNKEKAVAFLKKNAELNKQKTEKSFQETLLEMEVKYENDKKELRINALEKQRELHLWLSFACVAILLLVFGLLIYRYRLNIQKNKLIEHQVKQFEQEKLLATTQALLDGETAERSRLARDLHDGLGGILSVIKLNLKDMKRVTDENNPDSIRFSKALKMLDQGIVELRRVAHHMMPESLLHSGLRVSIEDFCRSVPGAQFQYIGEEVRLDSHLEVLIYRCVYELVNNAIKYAEATHINVQLLVDNSIISLTVQDNGIGFEPESIAKGSGLENLRARVSTYNGNINVYSSPGNGTEVTIEIELLDTKR